MAAWTLPAIIAEWCEILTSVLDRRSRKYFFTIILGILLGCGRRTVSCWLRAAGVSDDWQDHYYFLPTLGRKAKHVAKQLCHVAVRQSGWISSVRPKCVAGNDYRKRGRSFGHRTEFPRREGSAWCGRAAGPKRLVQCLVLEPVSLAAHNGGVVVMETFRDHIEATG